MKSSFFKLVLVTVSLFITHSLSSQCDITVSGITDICSGDCAEVWVEASGGTPPYSFQWSDGSTQQVLITCQPGTYCVTVVDSDGNACEACIDIVENFFAVEFNGPDCIPPNGAATIEAIVAADPNFITADWFTSDGNIISGNGSPFLVVNAPGTYCVTVIDELTGCIGEGCYTVGTGGQAPIIEVIAGPVCDTPESDSLLVESCQKVCLNTTITYAVTNANGQEVEWTIEGSEDYEINDDQVTVTWGESGFGEITASMGTTGTPPQPFYFECGQYTNVPQTGGAQGYVVITGGTGPYIISLAGINLSGTDGLNIINGLEPGSYDVIVTDGTGQSFSCFMTIQEDAGFCFPPIILVPEVIPASNCDECDGGATAVTYAGGPDLAYTWSGPNGFTSTESSVTGLCPGSYYVEAIGPFGCVDSTFVEIGCDGVPSCFGESSICIEILEDPIADFDTDPAVSGAVLEVCKGQPISFFNQSIGASTFIWDFGDFTNSVLENPIHTYPEPGTYFVDLIARNDCFCADTSTLKVVVNDLEIPEIKCAGTVCKGETVTYETEAACNSYNWVITGNATILDGGGSGDNFVTVEWNEGPEGTVELSVVDCNPELCDATAVEVIPIITDDISLIEGPDKVCPNEVVNYAITDFGGSDFFWSVSSGGVIIDGQGTNQITVEWLASPTNNPQSVSVNYENCYLECGGSDQMTVNIRSEFYVSGEIEICQGGSYLYMAVDATFDTAVPVSWDLTDDTGTSVFSNANSSSIGGTWNFSPGSYTLSATPVNSANSCTPLYEVPVEILELPAPPTAINGETNICPGTAYTYFASGLPGHEFHWQVNNGGTITEDFGNSLNVTWGNTPPYLVFLSQIDPTGLQCESETIMLTASEIQTFTISGDDERCKEEIGTYTVNSFENIDYQWTITPPNSGTIISGQGSNIIEVLWHTDGNQSISVDICGLSEAFNVTVHPLPQPVVNHPSILCPFETAEVTTTVTYSAYEWRGETGNLVSDLENPELGPGYYEVIVTDANGCTGNEIFFIPGYPAPNISISTPGELGLCPNGNSITLYALESSGGYTYQWFENDSPVAGANTSTLEISSTGTYFVQIVDENGCTANSNVLTFNDCSGTCVNGFCVIPPGGGGGGGGGCTPNGAISFTHSTTSECNTLDFQNTSTNWIPGTLNWFFSDSGSGANNTSTLENPSHTFTQPGFYRVYLSGDVWSTTGGGCYDWTVQSVMVPAAADFLSTPGCVGSPIQFSDRSTFLPQEVTAVTSWLWDFGDPGSGAANTSTDQNPSHTFPDDADYTVTLTITTDNGCTSTVQKVISVNPIPEVSFDPPQVNCQATAMNFVAITDANVTDVSWTFGDPFSGDANVSEQFDTYHSYDQPGTYSVLITARNIYGCTNSYTADVTVEPNNLTGFIDPANPAPICEGADITLTSSPGGSFWEWSTGEVTESITVSEEGIYTVTVTDEDGCTYSPPGAAVEVLPAPIGTIRVVEYNEFDQATAYFDDEYAVCEGEDVYLFAQTSSSYTFSWSSTDVDQEISFTEEKNNLLAEGSHIFTVTITNTTTGCTAVTDPFEVTIHPTPDNVTISSMPGGPLCDGTAATLSVDNPDASLTYVWNTGETGESIMAFAAGEYFVRAINSFGCEGESNRITIENAPDINKIPSGCHTRCSPDTLCLPDLPTVVSYQWYLDGVAIPAPEGTVADLIATESGEYTLEMVDIFGCTATSDPLNLDLYDGFGNVLGNVYFDVNDNGVIDGPDTLVSNIDIILIENGSFLETSTTNQDGLFAFPNILSTDYSLLLSAASLPDFWFAYQFQQDAPLDGCDDEIVVDFLLYEDCTSASQLQIEICDDETVDYNGTTLSPGDQQSFTLMNQFGCDSTVAVTVIGLPLDTEAVQLETCTGTMVEYNGTMLSPGDQQDFVYQNVNGCDSTVTVTVDELFPDFANLELFACQNGSVEYGGQTLFPGDQQDFVFQNASGCDSTVAIQVTEVIPYFEAMTLEACANETVTYNGQELSIGDQQDFVFVDQYGCDSTMQISVQAYPEVTFNLMADEICWNSTDGFIEVIDIQGNVSPVEFSLDDQTYQTDPLFENLEGDFYTIYVRDANGCVYEQGIDLPTIPPLELEIENAILECEQEGMEIGPKVLNANPSDLTWEWSNGAVGSSIYIEAGGVYSFQVSNQCETIQQNIEVGWGEEGRVQFFYLPNVFSPNEDGFNDRFSAYLEDNVDVMEYNLKIFNRWGTLLFESADPNVGWDAIFDGQLVKAGVYVVYLESKLFACGREIIEIQEADVTVLR